MTALAPHSAPDLTVLPDAAFDWLRRTVTEACAREIAAEERARVALARNATARNATARAVLEGVL